MKWVLIALTLLGCNKIVPPGTTVIVLKPDDSKPQVVDKGVYVAYGRDRVYFVDGKLKSFTENLKILCKDKVNLEIDVKWLGSFRVEGSNIDFIRKRVPSKRVSTGDIEGFELSLSEFYNTAIKDIIRASARMVISPYTTEAASENRKKLEEGIKKLVLERLGKLNYPVETSDVLISNIDFSDAITTHRQQIKNAELEDLRQAALAKAALRQAERDEEIARERGKALVAEAQAKAKANEILTRSLTPEILAKQQWEVLEAMAKGPNNEVIVVPYEALRPGMVDKLTTRGR